MQHNSFSNKLNPLYFAILLLSFFNVSANQKPPLSSSFHYLTEKTERPDADSVQITEHLESANKIIETNPDKALAIVQEQYELSKEIGFKWGIANSFEIKGNIFSYTREYEKALYFLNRSLKLYTTIGMKINAIDVQNNIGIVYTKQGNYHKALKYFLKTLESAEKLGDKYGMLSCYNNIGIIFGIQLKNDDALKYYFKAIEIQKKLTNNQISNTYLNIGDIYRYEEEYEQATKYLQLGLVAAQKEGDNVSLANNYSTLANVFADTKNYDRALEFQNKAYAIRLKIDDTMGQFHSLASFGNIYYYLKDYDNALRHTSEALALTRETGEIAMLAESYEQLAKIHAALGNYKEAFNSQKLFKKYSDSIFNSENERKLTETRLNYEFKQEQQKQEFLAQKAIDNQKRIKNFAIAGATAVVFAVIIFLRNRYRKKIKDRQKEFEDDIDLLQGELTVKSEESETLKIENENIQLRSELILAEQENERKEKQKLQEKLDSNRRELASSALYIYKKNQMLIELKEEIDNMKNTMGSNKSIDRITNTIQQNLYLDADWEKFKLHFEKVHPDFFKDLENKHPKLTAYEIRLYSYLHIKLSTKEIAGLLNITPASVIKAKVRLNKKLNGDASKPLDDAII